MDKLEYLNKLRALQTEGKSVKELYNKISSMAMALGMSGGVKPAVKTACYFSMEFLIGRSFYNNLAALGVLRETADILAGKGIDINVFEEIEDAALGNGGLGRLAACFMDSAAGLDIPLTGYGIRYKYGLFKQAIINGRQVELPDDWQQFGDPWSVRGEDKKRIIRFADMSVTAVPYDMPVFGKRVNILRLWQAEGSKEAQKISEYLYPADDTQEGKILRLRQEYFFSAASIGELIETHVKRHGKNFYNFAEFNAIQLNDTHPVLAIAEFIRILTSKYKVAFQTALDIARNTFSYTNHTVLPEALESWNATLVRKILPDIYFVLIKISFKQREELRMCGCPDDLAAKMAIYFSDTFSMANLAVYVGKTVNGVAKLHTEILKSNLFAAAFKYYPQKFCNITNGITQRRWLMLCNRELSALIDGAIGTGWREDISLLSGLKGHESSLAGEFMQVKRKKKEELFAFLEKSEGIRIPDGFLVFSQVKRLHEYKRQLMTAFALVELYQGIKSGKIKNFHPSVFIFGGKSAPSYRRAKSIIKYINDIAGKINGDKDVKDILKVVYVHNYNVSSAEKIMAGTDVSLQVSTAGLEASGTGNMKFMMNGAVTCGTMDGANIEIVDLAGMENNYIFGARIEQIDKLKREGYDPSAVLTGCPECKNAVQTLIDGTFDPTAAAGYKELYVSLIKGASWHAPDNYFVLYDLQDYVKTLLRINADYEDGRSFALKQLKNVSASAYFSSDRTIKEYAGKIWGLKV